LKEKMGVRNILEREEELLGYIFSRLKFKDDIYILADQHEDRLGVISIIIGELHHDLAVKILNDRFGIQSRGGCSCAGTYGHYLLNIDHEKSDEIIGKLESGACELKPGWVRFSIHPTTTSSEVKYVCDSIIELSQNYKEWMTEYTFMNGKFFHNSELNKNESDKIKDWFSI